MNPLLLTDSYKLTHWRQYPPGTQRIYSYFESRSGEYPQTCFFGLQYILQKYLSEPVTDKHWVEAMAVAQQHFGDSSLLNGQGILHLIEEHEGRWPVSIRAVPEGTWVGTHNVLMTIENTCEKCYWVPNFLETLLVQVWYPTNVATRSGYVKRDIRKALEQTSDVAEDVLPTRLHDFGFRGSTTVEAAGIGGAAHLVHFLGTDTLPALDVTRWYYGGFLADGISIPAYEHSTVTSWGEEHELDAYAQALEMYPKGYVAVVSDSYDIFRAVEEMWGGKLHDKVLARDGVLVIRPDSGDPETVVQRVLSELEYEFGATINKKGYKVLDPHVRVIQGDGMNPQSIHNLLDRLEKSNWSAENVAFGMGGGLLQNHNRDTSKFAFKCSAIKVQDAWREVTKHPVTDPGKNSKGGRLVLARYDDGRFFTEKLPPGQPDDSRPAYDNLVEVFRDGFMKGRQTLEEIRARAKR